MQARRKPGGGKRRATVRFRAVSQRPPAKGHESRPFSRVSLGVRQKRLGRRGGLLLIDRRETEGVDVSLAWQTTHSGSELQVAAIEADRRSSGLSLRRRSGKIELRVRLARFPLVLQRGQKAWACASQGDHRGADTVFHERGIGGGQAGSQLEAFAQRRLESDLILGAGSQAWAWAFDGKPLSCISHHDHAGRGRSAVRGPSDISSGREPGLTKCFSARPETCRGSTTHMKSTNMLERLMEEIKRRTYVVRIFPNAASCLRLVRALTAEMHDGWIEADRLLPGARRTGQSTSSNREDTFGSLPFLQNLTPIRVFTNHETRNTNHGLLRAVCFGRRVQYAIGPGARNAGSTLWS